MSEQQQKRAGAGTTTGGKTEDIFLSPRVVDRQAFNDFAGQLRELIEQATVQAEALRTAAGEAQRTRDGLREATNANQMKLDMATRALGTIDQKTDQVRRMIDSASDVASRMDGLREEADRIISERVGILCQRLAEAEDTAGAQVEDLHARLAQVVKAAEEQNTVLGAACAEARETLSGQLADLVQRAEAAAGGENGLGAIVQRAEGAGRTAIHATSELNEVRRQVDEARRILSDALNTAVPIIDEAGAIQGHLESTVSEAVRLSQTARQSMQEFVTAERQRIEEEVRNVGPSIEQARRELCQMIEQTGAACAAARDAASSADQSARALARVLQQVEPWKKVILGDSPDEPVGAAINGMVVELKKEIRDVAGALRAIAERAESALEPEPVHVLRGAAGEAA